MYADMYVLEQMMRERHAEALATVRGAALLRQSNERSRRLSVRTRCIERGKSLVKAAHEAFERLYVRTLGSQPRSVRNDEALKREPGAAQRARQNFPRIP